MSDATKGLKAKEVASFIKRGIQVPTMFGTIVKHKHNAELDEYVFQYESGNWSDWMSSKDRVPVLAMPATAPRSNCGNCGYLHKADKACADVVRTLLRSLIQHCGNRGTCRSCQAPIYWMTHRYPATKAVPYDASGEIHFSTCPNAKQHRREDQPHTGDK